jgi:GABA permease
VKAILAGTGIGYLSVIMAYFSPDTVYQFLVNSTGAVALFIYLIIAIAQLRMRARLEKVNPELLQVRMWAYPYLTYVTILGILGILVVIAAAPEMQSQLTMSLVCWAIVLIAYFIRSRKESGDQTMKNKVGAARSSQSIES